MGRGALATLIGVISMATSSALATTTAPGTAPAATGGGIGDYWWIILVVIVIAAAATAQPTPQDSHADGSEGILVRIPSETWRALEIVALEERRSTESVMMEAVD